MQWLASVLPEQAAGLATALMAALFARTDKSFRMRLTATLAQGALCHSCARIGCLQSGCGPRQLNVGLLGGPWALLAVPPRLAGTVQRSAI